MGSYLGHALPGSFFLLVGLWWLVHVVLEYIASLTPSSRTSSELQSGRTWKRVPISRLRNIPLEPLVKLCLAVAGICIELGRVQWQLVDENNQFQHPNKFGHASMYGFFGFSGLIELLNFYKLTNFSRELEYTMLATAFGGEGMLFYFHIQGRDIFDVRIHTILYIIIFLTALVILIEACLPRHQRELFMARTVLCLTQGTWFWEIAFTIYGSHRWIEDDARKMSPTEVMLDTDVVTVNICWHVLGWCGVVVLCCLVANCLQKRGNVSEYRLGNSSPECDKMLESERFDDQVNELDEEKGLLTDETSHSNTTIVKE